MTFTPAALRSIMPSRNPRSLLVPLHIPRSLPAHTRAWLAYIDSACAVRAARDANTKADQAANLLHHAQGETAYFARLYADMLDDQSAKSAA